MTKIEKSKKNLIILLIPPLLNYINWEKDSKNKYFFLADIINRQEKLTAWQKPKNDHLPFQQVEDLNKEIIYNEKIIGALNDPSPGWIILVNYPRNKESLQTLEKELWIREQKQPIFFFVSFNKKLEADFTELQVENIICPFCEKSWRKKEAISERKNVFFCPKDRVELNLTETEKITQYLVSDYFEKAAQIVEYQKTKKNKIITLELSIKPDFEPENLHQYLLEKLEKEVGE